MFPDDSWILLMLYLWNNTVNNSLKTIYRDFAGFIFITNFRDVFAGFLAFETLARGTNAWPTSAPKKNLIIIDFFYYFDKVYVIKLTRLKGKAKVDRWSS